MKTSVSRLPNKMLLIASAHAGTCNTLSTHRKLHAQKQAFELLFFLFKSMKQYFVQKIIMFFLLTYMQTICISFVLYQVYPK